MPRSGDRFARQNRCGPPPEFPPASACSGVVHHLSGPDNRAPAGAGRSRETGPEHDAASGLRPASLSRTLSLFSLRRRVSLPPTARASVRLLGPCFKTGRSGSRSRAKPPTRGTRPDRRTDGAPGGDRPNVRTLRLRGGAGALESLLGPSSTTAIGTERSGPAFLRARCIRPTLSGRHSEPVATRPAPAERRTVDRANALLQPPRREPVSRPRRADGCTRRPWRARAKTVPSRLPSRGFTFSLTLSSECFSTFPRGTCSLSVSRRVFSLRRSLPPALGCILKQPDSRNASSASAPRPYGPDTLYGRRPRSGGLGATDAPRLRPRSIRHNSDRLLGRPDSALGSSRFTRRY